MAQKNIKTRGLKPPWKKGQSGNPRGARPGVRHWRTVLFGCFEKGKISQEDLAQVLISMAKKGDMRALQIIMDRMDGKANEVKEVEPMTDFRGCTDEELMKFMMFCGAPPPKNGVEYSDEELEEIAKISKAKSAEKHR